MAHWLGGSQKYLPSPSTPRGPPHFLGYFYPAQCSLIVSSFRGSSRRRERARRGRLGAAGAAPVAACHGPRRPRRAAPSLQSLPTPPLAARPCARGAWPPDGAPPSATTSPPSASRIPSSMTSAPCRRPRPFGPRPP